MIRKRIIFTGRVQGVGFRWRARQAAVLYDCTGWCRNDPDGAVTMEIQGKEEAIDRVIEDLRSRYGNSIIRHAVLMNNEKMPGTDVLHRQVLMKGV